MSFSYKESSKNKHKNKINENITASQVRLIDEDGKSQGIIDTLEALKIAKESNLDLVEVVADSNPPVCKILDYDRFVFDLKKKSKINKKKQSTVKIKEIKFRPKIEEHDFQVKLKSIKGFIEDGNKVKVSMRLAGREIRLKDIGIEVLNRIAFELSDIARQDFEIKSEGIFLYTSFSPNKK